MSSSDNILIRSETRTDFLGEYIAYVYGDGHIETEPAGRPVTKEDFQRRRAVDLSQRSAREALASARIARSTGRANLNREQAGAAATASVFDEMRKTLSTISVLVSSTVATPAAALGLTLTADVGGTLVDPKDLTSSIPEQSTDESLRELR